MVREVSEVLLIHQRFEVRKFEATIGSQNGQLFAGISVWIVMIRRGRNSRHESIGLEMCHDVCVVAYRGLLDVMF